MFLAYELKGLDIIMILGKPFLKKKTFYRALIAARSFAFITEKTETVVSVVHKQLPRATIVDYTQYCIAGYTVMYIKYD
jgi:hypothetical protein